MTPRRLLIVSHGFPPYYGGAENAAGFLAAAAAASGRWSVQVLASDIGGRLPARESWRGCDIIRVRARKKEWTGHTVRELLSFLAVARTHRPSPTPDFIIANCALPAGAVAARLSRRTGAPYGVILHGSDVPGHQTARFGWIYGPVRPWVRRIWQRAAWVSAVSTPLRDLALQTWPSGRLAVIPNGVDTDLFSPAPAAPAVFPHDGNPAPLSLITIAQLIEGKGLHFLLEALALQPAARLTIYGSGPYEPALRLLADHLHLDSRVTFAGLAPSPDLANALRAADAFVLPSLREGLPLSLLEAMASGLPVVVSAVGGIPALIRDGHNGLLVPPADVPALADALQRLATDPSLRARLSTAARTTALTRSWNDIWLQYEALCANMTESTKE